MRAPRPSIIDTELEAIERRIRQLHILRCVPDHGSPDTVGPYEVVERLGLAMTPDHAAVYFRRLMLKGLVVRVRPGAYQLARKAGRT